MERGYMNKKRAVILYITYSVLLVLVITFGSSVGNKLANSIKAVVLNNKITDVALDFDTTTPIEAGVVYEVDYTVLGKYIGNPDISFESTDDALVITNGNKLKLYPKAKFDGTETQVDLIITSGADPKFEKVVTFTVKKRYPDDFVAGFFTAGYGYEQPVLSVGVSVYPYTHVIDDGIYINEYEILYDDEYITYDEEKKAYVPVKVTPDDVKLHFTVRYPDGRTADTPEFIVLPYTEATSFDEIRVSYDTVEEVHITTGGAIAPRLYSNGRPILSVVEIVASDDENITVGKSGAYIFEAPGNYTLTFTLPNGFSKTLPVYVRNVMALPILSGNAEINDHDITIIDSETSTKIDLKYPKDVTFITPEVIVDGSAANVTTAWKALNITPVKTGDITLTLVWDDGYDRITDTYSVKIIKNPNLAERIAESIEFFVSKILGHSTAFAILAVFTINLFKYIRIDNKVLEASVFFLSALPAAVLTEFIQSFMPHRFAKFTDVLIDTCGFLFGTIIYALIMYCKSCGKRRFALVGAGSVEVEKNDTVPMQSFENAVAVSVCVDNATDTDTDE